MARVRSKANPSTMTLTWLHKLLCMLVVAAALDVAAAADADRSNHPSRLAAVQRRARELARLREDGPSRPIFPGGRVPFFGDSARGRAAPPRLPGSWIVQLATPSAAAELAPPSGDQAAVAAAMADPTTDARGRNFTAARARAQEVDAHISAVASAVGVEGRVTHRYTHAMSGFVVSNITLAELRALQADAAVMSVTPNKMVHKATYTSPWFLGLTSRTGQRPNRGKKKRWIPDQGLWDKLGGVVAPVGAGEDVVIGVLDSGLWLEDHPSFADKNYWASANNLESQYYGPFKAWRGRCQPDEDGTPYPCNKKVIGCRFFVDGYRAEGLDFGSDFIGCKDSHGHGTHTAGTAAGNYGAATPISPDGSVISGMAPRARLAVYKVLWGPDGIGFDSDIIAGVEQAIVDGVDILSVSLGADSEYDTCSGPNQVAYTNAARAGVFVALAAGNAGPAPSTASNNALGAIAVAASTLPRKIVGTLQLGNGVVVEGAALQFAALGPLPLVYAANASAPGVGDALCGPGSLAPGLVAGKMVACDRGVFDRVAKADEVKRAGGKAMVLMNTPYSAQGVIVQVYSVPTIHIPIQERQVVLDYTAKASSPTALLSSAVTYSNVAPEMAEFSSRGPVPVANGAILKPEVTAPGVDILAPARFLPPEDGYAYFSGTSMATPHVSGVAALVKDKNAHWTPMMIKSALMTTAYTTNTNGSAFGTPLDFGAGHINPGAAMNPGLVLTSTYTDWQTLTCAVNPVLNNPTCLELCPSAQQVGQPARQLKSQVRHLSQHHQDMNSHRGDAETDQEADQSYHGHDSKTPHPPGQTDDVDVELLAAAATNVAATECPADKVSFDLNGPWVSGNVGGTLVVHRTLTAVFPEKDGDVHFTAAPLVAPNSSFSISVWPQSFNVRSGESVTVTITVKATSQTPLNKYQFGQVVWSSNLGHVVRIPVSVDFKAVLAPEVIAPVVNLTTFTYAFGIRTPGPSSVSIRSTPLQAADVISVDVAPSDDLPVPHGFYDFTVPQSGLDFLTAGLFFGDQPALLVMTLYTSQGDVVAGPSRIDSTLKSLLEVQGLAAGNYTLYLEATNFLVPEFTALLNVWRLAYQGAAESPGLMKVSPNPVPVDADGVGSVAVSFNGLTMPDGNTWPPVRYLGYLGYKAPGSTMVTDTTQVTFFFEQGP